jgi:opacity protein-like surface antigen
MIQLATKKNANRILALLRSISASSLSFAGFADSSPALAGHADAWILALLRSFSAGSLSFAEFADSWLKRSRFLGSCSLIMVFFCGSNLFAQRLSLTDVQAQPVTGPGPGLRIALGGTVNSDMSVAQRDSRDYPQTNINPLFATSVPFNGTISYESIGFNPGFRFDFAPGYRLNQWINFEFETGCIYNTVESYTISGNGTFTGVGGDSNLNGTMKLDAEGYLLQVPLMVNVEFSYPIGDGWRPFVGAGGGGMFQKLTVSTISGTINYQGDFNQSNFMGAWEAFLGCGYQVAPGFDVSIAYRVDGVLSPDFEMNWRF